MPTPLKNRIRAIRILWEEGDISSTEAMRDLASLLSDQSPDPKFRERWEAVDKTLTDPLSRFFVYLDKHL